MIKVLGPNLTPRKDGFTLLELLVAVTIFSGLMIVVLGSFSRSAFSLAGVNSLRQRSQAARGVVDTIGNDWQFLYLQNSDRSQSVNFIDNDAGFQNIQYRGFSLSTDNNRLLLLLKYPDQSTTELVRRVYELKEIGARSSVSVTEGRRCQINNQSQLIECQDLGPSSDLFPDDLAIDLVSDPTARSQFTGLLVNDASGLNPSQTGYLQVRLTVEPTELATLQPQPTCQEAPPGSCYTVSTTLNAGVVR